MMNSPKTLNKTMFLFLLYEITGLQILVIGFGKALEYIAPNLPAPNLLAAMLTVQDILLLALPVLLILFIFKGSFNEVLPFKRLSLWNIIYVVMLSFVMLPVIISIGAITAVFFPGDDLELVQGEIFKLPYIMSLTLMAILPAVLEEAVFRGVVFGNAKKFGLKYAIILSAVFFGLFHLQMFQLPYAIFAGIVFALVVYYTGSIFSSMLMHFIINGTQVTAAYYAANRHDTAASDPLTLGDMPPYALIILIFGVLLCLLLKGFIRYNKSTNPQPKPTGIKGGFIDVFSIGTLLIYVLYLLAEHFINQIL